MKNYTKFKWIIIIITSSLIISYELLRHRILTHHLLSLNVNMLISSAIFIVGSILGTHFFFRVIQNLEKERYKEEREVKFLFNNSIDGIFIFNQSGVLVKTNDGAKHLAGLTQDDTIYTFESLFEFEDEFNLSDNENLTDIKEGWVTNVTGSQIPVSVTFSLIPSGQQDYKLALIVRDLTQRKKMENVILELYQEAAQKQFEAELLYRISRNMVMIREIQLTERHTMLDKVMKDINKLIRASYCGLFIYDETTNKNYKLNAQSSPSYSNEVMQAFESLVKDGEIEPTDIKGVSFLPLGNSNNIYGYLAIRRFDEQNDHVLHHEDLIKNVRNTLSIFLENTMMFHRLKDVAILEERERLAREMHDGIAQTISLINLNIEQLNQMVIKETDEKIIPLQDIIKTLSDISKDAYKEVRQNLFNLRITKESNQSFIEILKKYKRMIEKNEDLEVVLEINEENVEDFDLSQYTKMHLIRIIQETLWNIKKHSHATKVEFSLMTNKDYCFFNIYDNGIGFNLQKNGEDDLLSESYGLRIMKERAQLINADIVIKSEPDNGTKIELKIPLRGEQDGKNSRSSM